MLVKRKFRLLVMDMLTLRAVRLDSISVTLLAKSSKKNIRDGGHLRNLSNFSKIKDAEIKCN